VLDTRLSLRSSPTPFRETHALARRSRFPFLKKFPFIGRFLVCGSADQKESTRGLSGEGSLFFCFARKIVVLLASEKSLGGFLTSKRSLLACSFFRRLLSVDYVICFFLRP